MLQIAACSADLHNGLHGHFRNVHSHVERLHATLVVSVLASQGANATLGVAMLLAVRCSMAPRQTQAAACRLDSFLQTLVLQRGMQTMPRLQVPIYDFKQSKRVGYRTQQQPTSRVVIIEGIYSLSTRLRCAQRLLIQQHTTCKCHITCRQSPCQLCCVKNTRTKHLRNVSCQPRSV